MTKEDYVIDLDFKEVDHQKSLDEELFYLLFNHKSFERAIEELSQILVCEGEFDAV